LHKATKQLTGGAVGLKGRMNKEETMKTFSQFAVKTQIDESKPVTAIGVDDDGHEFKKIFENYSIFEKWHERSFNTNTVSSLVNEDVEFEVVNEDVEQLDEEASVAYLAHHEAALTHVHAIAKALNSHKRALTSKGTIHHYQASDMKHITRNLEDLKDGLTQRAEQMHSVAKGVSTAVDSAY
jgi:hypothetical protein